MVQSPWKPDEEEEEDVAADAKKVTITAKTLNMHKVFVEEKEKVDENNGEWFGVGWSWVELGGVGWSGLETGQGNGWMNGVVNGWMNGVVNGWMNGVVNEWMNARMDG